MGAGFVCTQHEHAPYEYCIKKIYQGCIPVLPQYHNLAANIINSFSVWASVSVKDLPQAWDMLHHHYQTFHSTIQELKLPKDQQQPICPHQTHHAASQGASQAPSTDHSHSQSPDVSIPSIHCCSPLPSASQHAHTPSGSLLDNASEGIQIIEVLINKLQEEQILGISRLSRTSLWGFTHNFYWWVIFCLIPYSRFLIC